MEKFLDLAQDIGLNVLLALIILFVGRWVARFVSRLVEKALRHSTSEEALARFLRSLTYYGIIAFAVIAALDRLGIQTASLIAVLGAVSLAFGLALEGSLGNFAAGVLILVFQPFKIGNTVELAGVYGVVDDITVTSSVVITPQNRTVIIPNSQITGAPIVNYSKRGVTRLDLTFGIGYSDDLLKAKRILEEIAQAHPLIVEKPAPNVAVMELGDSSVNFVMQSYIQPEDWWPVHFDLHEQVKLRFDTEGISIPFPQRDVHLFQPNSN